MASASVRLITQGWNLEQRRRLIQALTPQQVTMVVGRIEADRLAHKLEETEARAAVHYVRSGGDGASYGIPEYVCACLFGRDPEFQKVWRDIRRMPGTDTAVETAQAAAGAPPSVAGSGMPAIDVALKMRGRSKGRSRARKKTTIDIDKLEWIRP